MQSCCIQAMSIISRLGLPQSNKRSRRLVEFNIQRWSWPLTSSPLLLSRHLQGRCQQPRWSKRCVDSWSAGKGFRSSTTVYTSQLFSANMLLSLRSALVEGQGGRSFLQLILLMFFYRFSPFLHRSVHIWPSMHIQSLHMCTQADSLHDCSAINS